MKINQIKPPRQFRVGVQQDISIEHCANIMLADDQQLTLLTESGTEYDIVRKSWGYYATPSMNGRLRANNLRAALVANQSQQLYLLLVESGRELDFESYLQREVQTLVMWLDGADVVSKLTAVLNSES